MLVSRIVLSLWKETWFVSARLFRVSVAIHAAARFGWVESSEIRPIEQLGIV